jgi:hypothetical protein
LVDLDVLVDGLAGFNAAVVSCLGDLGAANCFVDTGVNYGGVLAWHG